MTAVEAFQFPATGGTTNRSLAARCAEIKNVLDYGADPTGGNVAATTAAIQAAITAAANSSGGGGGAVIFPAGLYTINADLTNGVTGTHVSLYGMGDTCTQISGGGTYSVDNQGTAGAIDMIEGLTIGSVRFSGLSWALISRCTLGLLDASSSDNVTMICCNMTGNHTPGMIGVYTGDNTRLLSSTISGYGGAAVNVSGTGFYCVGMRTESNFVSFAIGKDRANADAEASGFTILAHETERNDTAVILYNAVNGLLGGSTYTGTTGNSHGAISAGNPTWAAGVVTVNTTAAHGLSSGNGVLIIGASPAGYNGYYIITVVNATRFTYAHAGVLTTPAGTPGEWYIQSPRQLYVAPGATVQNVSFMGLNAGHPTYIACIDLGQLAVGSTMSFYNCQANLAVDGNTLGAYWIMPPAAAAAGVKFVNCNNSTNAFPFANLPASPVEGMMFNVTNANTTAKTWGDSITAGGGTNTHALLRRNASAWALAGI